MVILRTTTRSGNIMHGNIGNGNEVAESFALGHRLCSGGILFRWAMKRLQPGDKNIISFVDRNC